MKIIAISRRQPGASLERIQALQVAEARAVWTLIGAGVIREMHFDRDRPCAIVTLEAASVAEAASHLATLPMVREGQIDFDYYSAGPFRQLEHLFAT
ncbi:MAG: superoxide dismutase [Alphaproteobacteria bacterium]|nr:superoxide dismutase [Alphaproteobacteria bacterium]